MLSGVLAEPGLRSIGDWMSGWAITPGTDAISGAVTPTRSIAEATFGGIAVSFAGSIELVSTSSMASSLDARLLSGEESMPIIRLIIAASSLRLVAGTSSPFAWMKLSS